MKGEGIGKKKWLKCESKTECDSWGIKFMMKIYEGDEVKFIPFWDFISADKFCFHVIFDAFN